MKLAVFIQKRRAELGLSLNEVAMRGDLTKAHVHALETGRADNPLVATICALAPALQVTAVELFKVAAELSPIEAGSDGQGKG